MSRGKMIVISAAFASALMVSSPALAEKINLVYVCGDTVEIQLASGTWLFADTNDGKTTTKTVDRIFSMAMAGWLAGKNVSHYYPQNDAQTPPPCLPSVTGYRISVLQMQ